MGSESPGLAVGKNLVEGLGALRDSIAKGQAQVCAEVVTCLERERARRVRAEALAKKYEAELANLRSQLGSLQRRAKTQEVVGEEDRQVAAAAAAAPAAALSAEASEAAARAESAAEAADRLRRELGCGDSIVCILGGTSFRDPDSEALVKTVAMMLEAAVGSKTKFLTGGMAGVQETFAGHCGDGSRVWNLLPVGQSSGYGRGTDINAGADLEERKAIFGLVGDIYITVEGGPGVSQEAKAAHARNAVVVPLMRTGGASTGEFDFPKGALQSPPSCTKEQWSLLANRDAPVDDSAAALVDIVAACIDALAEEELLEGTAAAPQLPIQPKRGQSFLRSMTTSLFRYASGSTSNAEDMEHIALTPAGKAERERLLSVTFVQKMHAEQGHWDGKPYEAVIFEGGGTKGMVYAGAIQRLDEAGLLKSVKCFAGTSAGAQTAALCAVGYNGKELREVMMNTPWKELLDSTKMGGCGCFSNFYRLYKKHGWCKGEVLQNHLTSLITQKCGENITLEGLMRKRGVILRVGACNVTTRRFELLDYTTHPHMPVAVAARASSNIPVVFVPVRYKPVRANQEYLYVDGGLEGNIPAKAFPGKRTLAFDLMSSGDWNKEHGNFIQPEGLKHFVGTLLDMVMNSAQAADGLVEDAPSDVKSDLHVVKINCGEHRMLETNLSKQQVLEMVAAGWDAVDDFLGEHGAKAKAAS